MKIQRWEVLIGGLTIEVLADRVDDQSDPNLVSFFVADQVVARFRLPQAWYLAMNQPS